MSYQVLARKWRPRDFASLVGQEHVVRALRHGLEQSARAPHISHPRRATVYVAGTSENDRGGADYLTVAFDSGTGSKVWAERYGPRDAGAAALIAGPTGWSVFVTGDMWDRTFLSHITTVAYAA